MAYAQDGLELKILCLCIARARTTGWFLKPSPFTDLLSTYWAVYPIRYCGGHKASASFSPRLWRMRQVTWWCVMVPFKHWHVTIYNYLSELWAHLRDHLECSHWCESYSSVVATSLMLCLPTTMLLAMMVKDSCHWNCKLQINIFFQILYCSWCFIKTIEGN